MNTQPPTNPAPRHDHALTHIKALLQTLKEDHAELPALPGGLFISGMLTGLASSTDIIRGGTAEQALEKVHTSLVAAVGAAYLAGDLPPRTDPAPTETRQTAVPGQDHRAVRGVQAWMAMDLHQALGLPVQDREYQGHPSWSDWWADLCGRVTQRTRAEQELGRTPLAVPDSLTFRNGRERGIHPEAARPERLFFPIGYGAVLAEAHPITPNDPPCMIDLVGYDDGDPLQERVLRLIVHRSLTIRLARDLASTGSQAEAGATASQPEPTVVVHTAPDLSPDAEEALGALVDVAKKQFVEEVGLERATGEDGEVSALEALGYHAMGVGLQLDRAEAERDGAYRERNALVALLAASTDGAVVADAPDVDEPGWQIAYLYLAGKQASWHFSPRDAGLIAPLEHVPADDPRAQWDGHTTEAKYTHIAELVETLMQHCGPACAESHTSTGRCTLATPGGEGADVQG